MVSTIDAVPTHARAYSSIRPRRSIPQPAHDVQTLPEMLERAAYLHPHAGVRFVAREESDDSPLLTYPELLHEARCILGGLIDHGLAPGANVVLLLEDARDFIPAFWACSLGGYVACPLMPIRSDAERWRKHLAHVNELLHQPLAVTTNALAKFANATSACVQIEDLRDNQPWGRRTHVDPEDPAVLVLTSGSTGNSKAVSLTHANILSAMPAKARARQMSAADVTMNWISFEHIASLSEAHLLSMYVGATQLHADASQIIADPLLFLRLIERHRVTTTFTPNFLLGHLNVILARKNLDELHLDLSRLRHIISGGEAVVVDTARTLLQRLAPLGLRASALWPAFGMTETCAGCVYSKEFPARDSAAEFANVGLPIDGLEMRVVDDGGNPLGEGQTGELQLRGPMVFSNYYNNETATRSAFTPEGWLRTGDLGRIDAGRLSLVGRSKDSIIVSGVNYFSHELETALQEIDGVQRSFVAAFPSRPKGADTEQLIVAFAPVPSATDDAALYRLILAIRHHTLLLWGFRPTHILALPTTAFPKTSLGKIQRSLMRKQLEAGEFAAEIERMDRLMREQMGGYVAPDGPTEQAIAAIFAEIFSLDRRQISATASFFDLGGTSLDILSLKQRLETQLGVTDVPLTTILQKPTARALAETIQPRGDQVRGYDPIVPLQTSGSGTPLFCVHPGFGEVLVFVSLAKYFAGERPFYALRARGFNPGEKHFESFDELVSCYVKAIRAKQPQGPYAICGYSYGGVVAFAIAAALESMGEEVAFASSIDMPPLIGRAMHELDDAESAVLLAFFLSLIDKEQLRTLPKQLRATPEVDPSESLLTLAPPQRVVELGLDRAKFEAWAALTRDLVNMGRAHELSGTVEAMTVFRAQPMLHTQEVWFEQHLRRWEDFSRMPVRYVDVPGEHHTLMDAKHVPVFQKLFRIELERGLAECNVPLQRHLSSG